MKRLLICLLSLLLLLVSCGGIPYKTNDLKIIGSKLTSNGDLEYAGRIGNSIIVNQNAGYWNSSLFIPITESGDACFHILMKDVFLKNIKIQGDQLTCDMTIVDGNTHEGLFVGDSIDVTVEYSGFFVADRGKIAVFTMDMIDMYYCPVMEDNSITFQDYQKTIYKFTDVEIDEVGKLYGSIVRMSPSGEKKFWIYSKETK